MKKFLLLLALLCSNILFFSLEGQATERESLKISVLPLLKSQVYLIQTSSGKNILYDTGTLEEASETMAYLADKKIKKLDLLIISHPHCANIGGAEKLLNYLPVNQILDNGIYYYSDLLKRYKKTAQEKKIMLVTAENGLTLPLDDGLELICSVSHNKGLIDEQALQIELLGQGFSCKLAPQKALFSLNSSKQIAVQKNQILQTDGKSYKTKPFKIWVKDQTLRGKSFILIEQNKHCLTLFKNGRPFKIYSVAVGKKSTPTPSGSFYVVNKIDKPNNKALGVRWIGFYPTGWPEYGIHGTNAPNSIGKSVSHGCVRMNNKDVLELYPLVKRGMPIKIVP